MLDQSVVAAGNTLFARGAGCDPLAKVVLTADSQIVGTTISDTAGRFEAPVQFADFRTGRRIVVATCGPTLTAPVDMVLSGSTGGNSTTYVLLLFFLLAGFLIVRFQFADGFAARRR